MSRNRHAWPRVMLSMTTPPSAASRMITRSSPVASVPSVLPPLDALGVHLGQLLLQRRQDAPGVGRDAIAHDAADPVGRLDRRAQRARVVGREQRVQQLALDRPHELRIGRRDRARRRRRASAGAAPPAAGRARPRARDRRRAARPGARSPCAPAARWRRRARSSGRARTGCRPRGSADRRRRARARPGGSARGSRLNVLTGPAAHDPGVVAAGAPLHRDLALGRAAAHQAERARHDVVVADRVAPSPPPRCRATRKLRSTSCRDCSSAPSMHRRRRQRHARLRDPQRRRRAHARLELVARRRAQRLAEDRVRRAGRIRRLQHHLGQVARARARARPDRRTTRSRPTAASAPRRAARDRCAAGTARSPPSAARRCPACWRPRRCRRAPPAAGRGCPASSRRAAPADRRSRR